MKALRKRDLLRYSPVLLFSGLIPVSCGSDNKKSEGIAADTVHDTVYVMAPQQEAPKSVTPVAHVDPLTQYALIDTNNYGCFFRDVSKLKSILKKLGFSVNTNYRRPDDEMASYTMLTASRAGANGGTTKIELRGGEDELCTIYFADSSEVSEFVESMQKSGYKKDRGCWVKAPHGGKEILVKVEGTRVKIISPFEMAPENW